MTAPDTTPPVDRAALARLAEAATAGPWEQFHDDHEQGTWCLIQTDSIGLIRDPAPVVASGISEADAAFIAAAREAVPGLLRENERLRAEIDGARRWIALIVRAAGGEVSVTDVALAGDTPEIWKSYDPMTFTTTWRARAALRDTP